VFAGGFTLAAAAAVAGAGDEEVTEEVEALVEQSLVRVADGTDGEPRFAMLETIREYAGEALVAAGEATEWRGRHAAHVAALIEQAEAALSGPDQAAWLNRLDAEEANIRLALAWLADGDPNRALPVAAALARYWSLRGHLAEGRGWLERVLATTTEAAVPAAIRLKALDGLGGLTFTQNDYPATRAIAEQALALAETSGDEAATAAARVSLGAVAYKQGDHATAGEHYEAALTVFLRLGDRRGTARARNNLGLIAWRRGELDPADALFRAAAGDYGAVGDEASVAFVLSNRVGVVADRMGPAAAAPLGEEVLAIQRRLGDRPRLANTLENLAGLDAARGDHRQAIARHEEALAIWRAIGAKGGEALSLQGLAETLARCGEVDLARARYGDSIRLWLAVGEPRALATALDDLGRLLAGSGDAAGSAVRLFGAAAAVRARFRLPAKGLDDGTNYARTIAALHDRLGPVAFAAAWRSAGDEDVEALLGEALASPLPDPGT
jgi:tetratricopeptide (TPR) repeat protein